MQQRQNRVTIPDSIPNQWGACNTLADKSPVLEGRIGGSSHATEDHARFVAVDVRPAGKREASAGASPYALTVVLGNGRTIELPGTLDSSVLVRLVVVLERVLDGSSTATRIYLAPGAFDMRIGFNGLFALVRDHLLCDPRSLVSDPQNGYAFVFSNALRNQLKVLYFDQNGIWVSTKRIEKGQLQWPEPGQARGRIVLSHEECGILLGGVDLANARRQRWCRSAAEHESTPAQMNA